ncbi:MAG: argininosuccinate synthase [Dehalococcoidia bacterium]|nr:argininosuccinate synthase [Dehalococcoidia bacterium]
MSEKVVLAYSGGLDTSVAIRWLNEKYGYDVVAVTIDVGSEKDSSAVKEKALQVGAVKAIVVDAKKAFVDDYIFAALKAGAIYENTYPMATALARPLIAKILTDVALEEGAVAIAHGCTGKGNDQVRFEVAINALAPNMKILAPAREWGMTREETIQYAERYGIPVPVKSGHAYSVDENIWGRSVECGILEDPWAEPPAEVYIWAKSPTDAPDMPAYCEITFEKGVPIALDGKAMDGLELINTLHEIAGTHGVGRIDHVENRLVGIKSREIYEAPAALTLLAAHQALEDLTLAKDQARFKLKVTQEFSDIIYNGLWFTANRVDLSAYVDSTQRLVSGTVRIKFSKGNCIVVGRRSPHSLYAHNLATYEKGDQFDQSSAAGFIYIFGLPVKTQAQLQPIFDNTSEKKDEGSGK